MLRRLADRLIKSGQRSPYYHLYHRDGSPYMMRYWLVPQRMLKPIECKYVDQGLVSTSVTVEPGFELRDDVRHLPAARLHNIVTPDLDREMHNHPWSFISIVLRGGYIERRPRHQEPRFFEPLSPLDLPLSLNPRLAKHRDRILDTLVGPPLISLDEEPGYEVMRKPGDIAFRSYNDRHRIVYVLPDTWTLILMGPKRQTWGFFTRSGFVNWREFSSAHNTEPV